jgi:hypothetical protein
MKWKASFKRIVVLCVSGVFLASCSGKAQTSELQLSSMQDEFMGMHEIAGTDSFKQIFQFEEDRLHFVDFEMLNPFSLDAEEAKSQRIYITAYQLSEKVKKQQKFDLSLRSLKFAELAPQSDPEIQTRFPIAIIDQTFLHAWKDASGENKLWLSDADFKENNCLHHLQGIIRMLIPSLPVLTSMWSILRDILPISIMKILWSKRCLRSIPFDFLGQLKICLFPILR